MLFLTDAWRTDSGPCETSYSSSSRTCASVSSDLGRCRSSLRKDEAVMTVMRWGVTGEVDGAGCAERGQVGGGKESERSACSSADEAHRREPVVAVELDVYSRHDERRAGRVCGTGKVKGVGEG